MSYTGKKVVLILGSQQIAALQDALGRLVVTLGAAPFPPILKDRIFNTVILANTDFFVADLVPTNTPTTFRIYVALDTAGILSVQRTSLGVPVAENLNSGTALVADASYMFNILVHVADTINLQTTVGAQILYCMVIEVPGVMA